MGAELLVGFIVVALIGKLIAHHFSAAQRIKRTLQAASRWPIAELPENTHGRVVGRARAVGGALVAPISGRACAYFVVDVFDDSGDSRYHMFTEERGVPFVIEDDTGRALVDPEGARITIEVDHETTSTKDDPPTPKQHTLLARHHQLGRVEKSLLYREAVIAVGEPVAVLGSGIREPDPDASPTADYRGALPTRLRLTSSPRYPLVISDYKQTVRE